jgi:hypothetical protein
LLVDQERGSGTRIVKRYDLECTQDDYELERQHEHRNCIESEDGVLRTRDGGEIIGRGDDRACEESEEEERNALAGRHLAAREDTAANDENG